MTNKPRAATMLLNSRFQHTCYASAMTLFLVIVVLGSIPGARHNLGQYASGLVLHSAASAILSALMSGAEVLLSEDMQSGMLVDELLIRNPFQS